MRNYETLPEDQLKPVVMADLAEHARQDNIVKGVYWKDGKGCAVGCLLQSGNHIEYEAKFGIPVALAVIEDLIFEGLSDADSKLWPSRFMDTTLSVGDTRKQRMDKLATVQWKFIYWVLAEYIEVEGEGKLFDDVRSAIKQSAAAIEPAIRGEEIDKDAAYAAADAAYAAAEAAARAAYAAAHAAADAAARAAYAAAHAAAHAAAYAARAAVAAARATADAADAADAADKLIELINAAQEQTGMDI